MQSGEVQPAATAAASTATSDKYQGISSAMQKLDYSVSAMDSPTVKRSSSVTFDGETTKGDAEGDCLFDMLQSLDLDKKDVLFLGRVAEYQWFTWLLRKVTSLEIVKTECGTGSSRERRSSSSSTRGAALEGGRERQRSGSGTEICLSTNIPKRTPHSKDVIVMNCTGNGVTWEQLEKVLLHALKTLRPGGFLVARECLAPAPDAADQRGNYNDPAETYALIRDLACVDDKGVSFGFRLGYAISPDPQQTKKRTEMCWLLEKVSSDDAGKQLQKFLDEQQYSRHGILKYEAIFGDNFVSTGGHRTTAEFCQLAGLQRGQHVLDVGCGIGGSAFHMAKEYGVNVTGVDLSSNMFAIAVERRRTAGVASACVDLEIADILTREYPAESFDLIYSRDVILHIADKRRLFTQMLKWLKPGGKVLITDYCCGDKEHSADFKDYVQQRGYILLTVQQYGKLLEEVGFVSVRAEDRTQQFISVLHNELRKFEPLQSEFIEQFSPEDYEEIVTGWNNKVTRCHAGDQAWGLFIAHKPPV